MTMTDRHLLVPADGSALMKTVAHSAVPVLVCR
jgi:hypothetical protein